MPHGKPAQAFDLYRVFEYAGRNSDVRPVRLVPIPEVVASEPRLDRVNLLETIKKCCSGKTGLSGSVQKLRGMYQNTSFEEELDGFVKDNLLTCRSKMDLVTEKENAELVETQQVVRAGGAAVQVPREHGGRAGQEPPTPGLPIQLYQFPLAQL